MLPPMTVFTDGTPVGTHSVSQFFMAASAAVCTAAMVGSARPDEVPISEQWKPSPTAIGC
jgi:hypothetical protein